MLGELGKVVRVSVVRFLYAHMSCGGGSGTTPLFDFAVAGAPGELVDVAVLTPSAAETAASGNSSSSSSSSGVVRRVRVVVGPTGRAVVTCQGDGSSSANPCSVLDDGGVNA